MSLSKLAQTLYAGGLAGLGVLSLIYGDFALVWQPVPEGVPGRKFLAYVSGAILLIAGLGALVRPMARRAMLVLALFVFSWLVLLQVPRVTGAPGDEGMWLGLGENTLSVTGGWVLVILLTKREGKLSSGLIDGDRGLRMARVLFAAALPVIGLSHFVYTDGTAGMVPAWLPDHRAWALLTGAGHMAAGFGILLGIVPRLAATMEAAMISCFVLLLHMPGVVAAPTNRLQWTMLCVATVYTGAAWAMAGTFKGGPWWRLPGGAKGGTAAQPAG